MSEKLETLQLDAGINAGDHTAETTSAAAAQQPTQDGVTAAGSKKKSKKKAKKVYVGLPAVEALVSSGQVPWAVAFTQRLGRHVVATRPIKAGELVLRERAVAAIPRQQFAPHICHACFADLPAGGMGSQDASRANYCSAACRQARAARDALTQPLLPLLERIAEETDVQAELLRIIVELDVQHVACSLEASLTDPANPAAAGSRSSGEAAPTAGQTNGSDGSQPATSSEPPTLSCGGADLNALLTHWERMPSGWRDTVTAACSKLHDAIAESGAYTPSSAEQLQQLAAVVNSNAHGTGVGGGGGNTDQGLGVWPGLSLLNHSCAPNCCFSATGDVIEVRAVRDIDPTKAGQELTVQYLNLLEPRPIRARILAETKFFACACARCSAPLPTSTDRFLEGVVCPQSGCKGVLLSPLRDPLAHSHGGCGGGCGHDHGHDHSHSHGPEPDWQCTDCSGTRPARSPDGSGCADVAERAHAHWQMGVAACNAHKYEEARPLFEWVLAHSGGPGQLHPLHVTVIDCRTPLLNCCQATSDTKGAIEQILAFTAAWDAILDSMPSPELANYLSLLAKLQAQRAEKTPAALRKRFKQQAAEAAAQAAAHRRICLGSSE